jgi:O-antigen/teichoic acid export membrane protein
VPVAVGLAINGAAIFGFLAVSSHLLTAGDYAALSSLWGLLYAVGNGVMQPLEQEVARAVSERRANGIGPAPVIKRAATIGASFTAVVCVGAILGRGRLLDSTLDGNTALEVAFVVGLAGFCVAHLTRGTLSSHGRFRAYGLFFSLEGIGRVAFAIALGIIGIHTVGAYGIALAVATFVAAGIALSRQKGLLEPGPPARWSELSSHLGWLLLGTVSLSFLLQGGIIAVGILAPPGDPAAGQFLNGLQLSRIPLFLFQAVLASLLPKLSQLASEGKLDEFTGGLRRLVGAILALGVVATIAIAIVGPPIMRLVFGANLALGSRDLAVLTAASILIMATICLDQALIALRGHHLMALGWLAALATFVVVTALGSDLFLRVELGLLAGSVVALVWMVVCLAERLRRHARAEPLNLAESMADLPVE